VPIDQNGRLQPLLAIYSKECLSRIEEQLDENLLRVDLLFDVIPTHYVVPADYAEVENADHLFTNVNEPADMTPLLKIE
jgi:molybdopterin-guanine dinucleotide biosynthesis protein A